ncbi:ATP-binding cassette domain-containing protein [Sneathiella sp. P13V-1]|uniref:ABC transporter ATP-binding protein n=1 Tax=Sneathiella sp. P13V-1 TaxID=2697366 RepID=UPI00187B1932|nr:ABC transporter ATP-binding protein [Sneathiella sp. P13V-1]MBE7638345.1 ATP-binding cassette domain-containing protein [Sneathiella sp. P13V-1]
MAGITLKSITKSFDDLEILKGINLDISDGEFITLVGPSGCGKSTLLRIIAGLEGQSGGDVILGDRSMNGIRSSHRDLAMVFQSYALYPHLSVKQNMETPLKLRDLSFLERLPIAGMFIPGRGEKLKRQSRIVSEVSQTLKIEHLLDRKPGQLSGGQRQRVALGRAMVRKPAAFLMDEPLSNLDAALRVHMRAELAELHRSLSTTFIYVTHDQAEALTMSDRMAVMMDGEILQLGAPDEIYKNPVDRRVAEFVGSPKINMLPGKVGGDGRVQVHNAPLEARTNSTNKSIFVGVRPEHFHPIEATSSNANLPFRVTHKENLGSDFFLHGHINGSDQRIVSRATPEDAASISIGADIFLKIAAGKALLFGEDNRRIALLEA